MRPSWWARIKPCLASAILRTRVYAWTTSTRFGRTIRPCPMCRTPNTDTLAHFHHECPALATAFNATFRQHSLPCTQQCFFFATPYQLTDDTTLAQLLLLHAQKIVNAIHIYAASNTYHSLKYNSTLNPTHQYAAHVRRLLQHDHKLVQPYNYAIRTNLYPSHTHH